jgi:hypothetical protein
MKFMTMKMAETRCLGHFPIYVIDGMSATAAAINEDCGVHPI